MRLFHLNPSSSKPGLQPGFLLTLALYALFILSTLGKLRLLHSNLQLPYITMDAANVLIAIGSLLALSFWIFWLPSGGQLPALAGLHLLITGLIFADLIYFRYFGDFITVPVLLQAGQMESLGGSIAELLRWQDLWLFADWPLMLAAGLWSWRRRSAVKRLASSASHGSFDDSFEIEGRSSYRYGPLPASAAASSAVGRRSRRLLRRFAAGLLVLTLGLSAAVFPIRHASQTWAKNLLENNWWNMSMYNVTGLLAFHAIDAYQYAQTAIGKGRELPSERIDEIRQWFAERESKTSGTDALFGRYKDSNIIVVQGEAFMNFFVGKKLNGQSLTPNLDKLMEDSLYFDNFYHQTGQGRTSDADFSANASLHPLPSGSVFIRHAENVFHTMPSILKQQGYAANAYHAYDGSFWNRNRMYKEMGYDRFYAEHDFEIDERLGWSLGDRSFLNQSVGFMEQTSQPFYSFLITLSSHHPYNLNLEEEDRIDLGEFQDSTFGNYLQSMHYLDSALGDMVNRLKEDGLWEKTIFVFYGDHDYSLNESAAVSRLLGGEVSAFDYERMMAQVPLLIHLPDGAMAGTYENPGGQLDLMPTLLPLLGIDTADYFFMGSNLLDRSADKNRLVVLRSGAFTDGTIYYTPSADGVFENGICYDLATGQQTDVNKARAGYAEAVNRLAISDDIITRDLIPVLQQN
ncbi:LTA synthase family protein [Saccharibacillus kuerlensis]|uniref:Sulfatase N-terminal domain-containing protein n=1 Tax=Saccharibacillus kuerlensis TaxID=459527 RepID=A0ABQ2KU34_9BACL|nr:LTA synthase family protein [Saccharibacillus kuerlensis]GGN91558.1 hypothetical protein GCM10010969_03370 [Saccharibacillus kuerlensis]